MKFLEVCLLPRPCSLRREVVELANFLCLPLLVNLENFPLCDYCWSLWLSEELVVFEAREDVLFKVQCFSPLFNLNKFDAPHLNIC